MTAATIAPDRPAPDNSLVNAAIVIVVGVLATTLAQPQVLARLPLQNLLKNELHVSRSASSAFFFWMGLAWYFKPLAGIFTDAFPVFGSRRKSYLLISVTMAVMAWVGLYFTPHAYNSLLWVCIVINAFMMTTSTVIGAYMVETAQAVAGSGRLTALRQIVTQMCTIAAGPSAGYLASIAFGWTAAACGGVAFLLVPVTIFFLNEQRKRINSREMLVNAARQLENIGSARTMWAAAGLLLLFFIAPGFSTVLFYIQQNDLHMKPQDQGFLAFIAGCSGIFAAVAYGFACRHFNLRMLLVVCILLATISNLAHLFYTSVGNAQIIAGCNGFGYTLAELALMDLAVRATPIGSEGLGFSLMMSVRNLALFGTDWVGSSLMDAYHLKLNTLVLANAATTLVSVPLVLLLPHVLVRRKDADLYEEAAEPVTAPQP
ncbi:MAG: MFS transporter [Caulobacterales bacterium]